MPNERILGQASLPEQKFWVWKKLGSEKNVGMKKYGFKKIVKIKGFAKKNWVQKFLDHKKMFGSKENLDPKSN